VFGNGPVSVKAGVGAPVVVTLKVPLVPTVYVTVLALVIAGACTRTTLRAKFCVAFVPTPLEAVITRG